MHSHIRSQQPGGLTDKQIEHDAQQSYRQRNWLDIVWTTPALSIEYQINDKTLWNTKLFGTIGDRSSVGFLQPITIQDSINTLSEGTDYTKMFDIQFSQKSLDDSVLIINNFISGVFNMFIDMPEYAIPNNLKNEPVVNIFPFVVTPSKLTYQTGVKFSAATTSNDIAELNNYLKFTAKITINTGLLKRGWFLVWENKNNKPILGQQFTPKIDKYTPSDFLPSTVSYGVLGAQKVYLLSQDSEGPKGKISLSESLYGIKQSADGQSGAPYFIGDNNSIEYKTYPMVRGDEIIRLIRKIFSFVTGHVHPTATMAPIPVAAGNGQTSVEIDTILADAENTILNQNIRIN